MNVVVIDIGGSISAQSVFIDTIRESSGEY